MKLRMLPLALIGIFSGPTIAQSSANLYGVLDLAVQNNSFDRSGAAAVTQLTSGFARGPRFGFRGTENLGGGLRARFQIEGGFNAATGTSTQGGRVFGRQTWVGLEGSFGMIALGRMGTVGSGAGPFEMVSRHDPFEVASGIAGALSTFSEVGGHRVDNAIVYQTPRSGGFQAAWIHSFQASGTQGASGANTTVDSLGANYTAGRLSAAATYLRAQFPDATKFKDQVLAQVGATYDLTTVKLHALYANEIGVRSALISAVGSTADGTDAKSWMLGATVPVGANRFLASYQVRDGKQQTVGTTTHNADRTVWAIGYQYWMSKNTYLSATHASSSGSGSLQVGTAATDFANVKQTSIALTHGF